MTTIQQLEVILGRLENAPLNLVRVELEMFWNAIERNMSFHDLLVDIIVRNQGILGAKVSTIAEDVSTSLWTDLGFASSAPLRGAAGYQMCSILLQERNPIELGNKLFRIGSYYAAYRGNSGRPTPPFAFRVFSDAFLRPLVSYLAGALDVHDQILLLLSRYKQRCEWFPEEELIRDASTNDDRLEKRLKANLLRYLFDNGIVFSIESQTPAGGGKVDILPVLPDIGPLPIEVKVFDGKNRDVSYISRGIAQAADYARKFNSSRAHYLVYNIQENTVLRLPGVLVGPNIVNVPLGNVAVYSAVANVGLRTLPASRSSELRSIEIPLPM